MEDNLEIIKCPQCGKEMKKVFFSEQGINLDVCVDGCGGIYFDNREFSKFDEKAEDITPLEQVFAGKTYEEINSDKQLECPVCGANMVKNHSSAKQEIQVDDCYNCGGKFLNHNELEKIRAEYNKEEDRAKDVIEKLYNTAGLELQMHKTTVAKARNKSSILAKMLKLKF